jgi:hypothetical protein
MTAAQKKRVWSHLLPRKHFVEQASFLFVVDSESGSALLCQDVWLLGEADFAYQSSSHIEISDSSRARLIKHAHDTKTSIVEIHSHLGHWPACFSPSDLIGLREWVPHVRWRLAGRAYAAVVVARRSFDGLVWRSERPERIRRIRVLGRKALTPTGLSPLELKEETID